LIALLATRTGKLQDVLSVERELARVREEIERVLARWAGATWDIGRAFGTIGSRKGPFQVEITTYRSESYDRTSRKPAVDFGDSLEGDLGRRDFTVNAMAVRVPSREFVDPYGGVVDLAHGLLQHLRIEIESHGLNVTALFCVENVAGAADLEVGEGDLESRAQL